MENKNGGFAYPVRSVENYDPGMTMRQAYKIAALQGLFSAGHQLETFNKDEFAKMAGEYADAMLAEDAEHAKVSP